MSGISTPQKINQCQYDVDLSPTFPSRRKLIQSNPKPVKKVDSPKNWVDTSFAPDELQFEYSTSMKVRILESKTSRELRRNGEFL